VTAAGAKVLIVDDDPEFVEFVGKLLVTSGYDVDRALHGADALMAIALARPDVVLLDVRMSGIHGVDVLKRIRSMDPTIPVIMVTADDDPVLLNETRQMGAYGYLVKPFDVDDLTRMVGAAVAGTDHREPPDLGRSPA